MPIVPGDWPFLPQPAGTMHDESRPPLRKVTTGTSDTRRARTPSRRRSRTSDAASLKDFTLVETTAPLLRESGVLQNCSLTERLGDLISHEPGLSSSTPSM